MATVGLDTYREIISDRPHKLTAEQVGYKKAEAGEAQCKGCLHFFERRLDKFGVCEVFRDEKIDEDGINPAWTCSFQTINGKDFPLLSSSGSSNAIR